MLAKELRHLHVIDVGSGKLARTFDADVRFGDDAVKVWIGLPVWLV